MKSLYLQIVARTCDVKAQIFVFPGLSILTDVDGPQLYITPTFSVKSKAWLVDYGHLKETEI